MWTYNDAGNILTRTEYAYTTGDLGTPTDTVTYTYGDSAWADLLKAYDGVARTYDTIGNLLTDGTWTYTWQNGRELASMSSGSTTWTYTYDANGMRTSRSYRSMTYSYVYNGSQLVQMTKGTDTLYFAYGVLGPKSVTWRGTTYYYVTNLQGDVISIIKEDGTEVVKYYYDAWGNIVNQTGSMAFSLGILNPLCYRGYVCDLETGLYYLQSRYYDPQIGRFINADALVATGQGMLGNNMFAYCSNNPVKNVDHLGYFGICVLSDPMNVNRSLMSPGMFGGGGGGHVADISSSYSVMQNVREYDNWWRNSCYNVTSSGRESSGNQVLASENNYQASNQHTIGTTSPKRNINPGGSYVKMGENGKIYSYTQFDSNGNQTLRIDFQGRPHNGELPHVHIFSYPERGGRNERVYNLLWKQID